MATRAMSTEAASKTSDTPNMENYNFETLKVTQPKDFVLHVELNRPEKRNAMNTAFWREMVQCFQTISTDKDCRAVVVSGAGKMFTSGIDLIDAAGILAGDAEDDISRKATKLHGIIQSFQQSFTSIEKCPKPVIAAVHSACIGGGIDLISACDIRYCTQDAWFQIKEVDIGLAADVGTLQRLPKIVGNDSLVRELTYTARRMMSDEAQQCGLVSRTFPDKESMVTGALETAALIALKSPVAVQGTKINLVYSRDHSVDESLRYIAAWNQCMLQSEDLVKAVTAVMEKTPPVFSKL
ncbi:Delta(3,5)-Delta(2,4)-dienoyl-CoA isomerase, mitochondrial [Lamellibrachia satsuma]|nr:Delta(3,5)-Delta(2,4)-dienoyl-CoA isomerase, mitochondrial [Lamellibrachia satsuma]